MAALSFFNKEIDFKSKEDLSFKTLCILARKYQLMQRYLKKKLDRTSTFIGAQNTTFHTTSKCQQQKVKSLKYLLAIQTILKSFKTITRHREEVFNIWSYNVVIFFLFAVRLFFGGWVFF